MTKPTHHTKGHPSSQANDKTNEPAQTIASDIISTQGNESLTPKPSISIDWDYYAEFLKDVDLSDEEKHEFLQALLSIQIGFVDLGFNVHPAQLAVKNHNDRQACGSIIDNDPKPKAPMLTSEYSKQLSKTTAELDDADSAPQELAR